MAGLLSKTGVKIEITVRFTNYDNHFSFPYILSHCAISHFKCKRLLKKIDLSGLKSDNNNYFLNCFVFSCSLPIKPINLNVKVLENYLK